MKLSDFFFVTKHENVKGNIIAIAFLDASTELWPDVLQPVLIKQNGTEWDIIDERVPVAINDQEDVPPEIAAKGIVIDFNKTIATLTEGGVLTWNQQLILIFQTRLALVNNQFVLN